MKNKIIFYGIALLLVLSGLTYLYIESQSKDTPIVSNQRSSSYLNYDEVNSFVLQQEKEVCLFFFSSEDTDSQHVMKTIIDPIAKEIRKSEIPDLYYVDLLTLPNESGERFTKNNWGFFHYPTFIVMDINNNQVEIKDILEWDPSDPYDINDVKKWLQSHQLIK
ncbi:MAG: hypothetical protein PUF50_06185 [Erysipelotrichaceae bacterium]|nr:hypothetical protein [Erysipelotrichaceae bacterium]